MEPNAASSPLSTDDLANNPQPIYRSMRELAGVMPIDDLTVVVCRRAEIDEVFRRADIFSSNMSAVDLQNVRPLIPLQIDPPDHKKYRKILDPLFAPRQMALLEPPITSLVNDLIDRFEDRDEIDFATEFSIPFPSQVFLTMLGLPLDELPTFLAMKDGIIRPDHVVGDVQGGAQGGRSPKGDGRLDLRLLRRRPRPAPGGGPRRPPHHVSRRRSRRALPVPGGHPRHLLPASHRRPRHGDGVPRLLLRLPRAAPRAASAPGR